MAINVFEGGRRITYLLVALYTLITAGVYWSSLPAVTVGVEFRDLTDPGFRTDQTCGSDDRTQYRNYNTTPNGTNYSLELCFKAAPFPAGKLVPYRRAGNGNWWGDTPYSTEVSDYTAARTTAYTPTPELIEWIDGQRWPVRWKQTREWATAAGVGVFVILCLSAIIGWIVRGFRGIPAGHDFRPAPRKPADDEDD